jgi:hypothetical protein
MMKKFCLTLGAEIATGETLTFLDAHIECSPGWLQYLLYEVKKDRYVSSLIEQEGIWIINIKPLSISSLTRFILLTNLLKVASPLSTNNHFEKYHRKMNS